MYLISKMTFLLRGHSRILFGCPEAPIILINIYDLILLLALFQGIYQIKTVILLILIIGGSKWTSGILWYHRDR